MGEHFLVKGSDSSSLLCGLPNRYHIGLAAHVLGRHSQKAVHEVQGVFRGSQDQTHWKERCTESQRHQALAPAQLLCISG